MSDITYDRIGTGYNSTRRADPFIAGRLYALLQPQPGMQYLDIGCGTGNYTSALASRGLQLTGVDPSEKMLTGARAHTANVRWLRGTAEQIPATNAYFDGVLGTLTIHHWPDLPKAFGEIRRVLAENGRFVLFTSTAEQMESYWLNHYFPQMLRSSIEQMPSEKAICEALDGAGFRISVTEKYFIHDELQDLFLYCGKNRPALYFDEQVRSGISSFAALANREEVTEGLAQLRSDIESGHFKTIRERYADAAGDYVFVVAE